MLSAVMTHQKIVMLSHETQHRHMQCMSEVNLDCDMPVHHSKFLNQGSEPLNQMLVFHAGILCNCGGPIAEYRDKGCQRSSSSRAHEQNVSTHDNGTHHTEAEACKHCFNWRKGCGAGGCSAGSACTQRVLKPRVPWRSPDTFGARAMRHLKSS